ncbi:NUDIX domain-containing protein [Luteimicrobium subarcticum]|uniref:Putative NUDIX family NTP pyrophosphohydrolase n=1 Tax=Luteimicrobium subarcticum TaxID=620910 RepID=A0A2M8WS64_9MICO|nr:NUDIX domain-containing protein [Luteimicrobium subarcticum]PJI93770.1 putative NUDIX family NTP pyrophosphohydrolase [Luteimicrobium subarcticum]
MTARSAGLLLYRDGDADAPGRVVVLVAHMGGPFWARKDARAWSIPKGELGTLPDGSAEDEHDAAVRETTEELGVEPPTAAPDVPLGTVRQRSGKEVVAWARRVPDGWDLPDPGHPASNTFELEWPPRSRRTQEFPEVDRTRWVGLGEARDLLVAGQVGLLDRLETHLAGQANAE